MATALARGWLAAGLTTPDRIVASDPLPQAREAFERDVGARAVGSNREVVKAGEVVVLAVKPQMLAAVVAEIQPALTPGHLVVSIVAGVTLAQLTVSLGAALRIVRVMPNTPSLVGASAAAFSAGSAATPDDEK